MSDGIKFLTDVVPELADKPIEEVKRLWREWANNQPPDVRLWLKDPLSPSQRRTLQCGFGAEYYQSAMLIAFQNTQEERHQKLMAADPRTQERRPILEAAQDDYQAALDAGAASARQLGAAQLVERTLPDGSTIYAATEAEADAIVAHEAEKAADPEPDVPWADPPTSSGV